MAAIIRVTDGKLRLRCRLLTQMERILAINNLLSVTSDVMEASRESLLIGDRSRTW